MNRLQVLSDWMDKHIDLISNMFLVVLVVMFLTVLMSCGLGLVLSLVIH